VTRDALIALALRASELHARNAANPRTEWPPGRQIQATLSVAAAVRALVHAIQGEDQ